LRADDTIMMSTKSLISGHYDDDNDEKFDDSITVKAYDDDTRKDIVERKKKTK
jgi:hypothetical protein